MTSPNDAAPMTEEHPAVANLRANQRQLDMDGCEVGVSRQAIDETLEYIAALQAGIKTHLDDWSEAEEEAIKQQVRAEKAEAELAQKDKDYRHIYRSGARHLNDMLDWKTKAIRTEAKRALLQAELAALKSSTVPTRVDILVCVLEIVTRCNPSHFTPIEYARCITDAILALLASKGDGK